MFKDCHLIGAALFMIIVVIGLALHLTINTITIPMVFITSCVFLALYYVTVIVCSNESGDVE